VKKEKAEKGSNTPKQRQGVDRSINEKAKTEGSVRGQLMNIRLIITHYSVYCFSNTCDVARYGCKREPQIHASLFYNQRSPFKCAIAYHSL